MNQAYHEHFAKLRRSAPHAEFNRRESAESNGVLRRVRREKGKKQGAKIGIFLATGFFIASACGLLWDEDFFQALPQVKWSWVTEGYAADSKKAEEKYQKTTDKPTGTQVQTTPAINSDSLKDQAEGSALGPLVELQARLKQKEAELNALEQELSRKEKALAEQLSELQKIRDEISSKVQKTIQESDKTVDQLVEVYSAMKPAQAAEILSQLQDELATKILSRMKKKTAAEIMGFLKPEKAKSLTERIAGFTNP